MTWRTDVWATLTATRPLELYLAVANTTPAPLDVAVRVAFTPTGARTQRATVAVGESFGWRLRSLVGSRASDPLAALGGLTVTCAGGTVACPVSLSLLAAPTCTP